MERDRPTVPPLPARPPTDGPVPIRDEIGVRVVVIDGDTRRRLPGARVRIGARTARADGRGRASAPISGPRPLRAGVSARGYRPRTFVLRPRTRAYVVRLYRPDLQWPVYGATAARTQAHPAINLRPPFRPVWVRPLGDLLEFPAVVWEGVAYVSNFEGYLFALSMRTGAVLWRTRIGSTIASSPALAPARNELVAVTKSPGEAVVVDMRTGRVKWRFQSGAAEPSPVIREAVVYFGATNGNVYALDLVRRRPRWTFAGGSKVTSSPALVGDRVYFGDYSGRVRSLDAGTGAVVWTGSAGSRVYGTVAVAGGRVFAPSVFSGLSALSADSGALLWRIPVGAYLYSSPAYYRGRVYFGTYAGVLYCADASSGSVLWRGTAGGEVSGAPQVVAGVVYAGSLRGRITAWHWRTGRRLWMFPHGQYAPVSGSGGRLLLHGYSKIWAVEPMRKRR